MPIVECEDVTPPRREDVTPPRIVECEDVTPPRKTPPRKNTEQKITLARLWRERNEEGSKAKAQAIPLRGARCATAQGERDCTQGAPGPFARPWDRWAEIPQKEKWSGRGDLNS